MVCLLFICSLFSCSGVSEKILMLEGNYLFSRHRHNEAIEVYYKALANEQAAPYAEYGLGAVYHLLDENKAALERFTDSQKLLSESSHAGHRELRYRTSYNMGVVYFAEEDFSAAAESFRQALRIDSGRIEAKRNLELSLLSIAREESGDGQPQDTMQEMEGMAALFEYFREREQNQWRGREWAADEQDRGPRY